MSLNPHYTRKTLSEALNISISTIKRHEQRGLIEYIRIGRLIRYAPDTITKLSYQKPDMESDDGHVNHSTSKTLPPEAVESSTIPPETIEPPTTPESAPPALPKRPRLDGPEI